MNEQRGNTSFGDTVERVLQRPDPQALACGSIRGIKNRRKNKETVRKLVPLGKLMYQPRHGMVGSG